MEAQTVAYSQTTITELMIPSYANFGGKIHGGTLLSLMDKVAYACASKHAGTYCVTVSVDTVNFLQPVEVGELVSLMASVNYVGSSSLVVDGETGVLCTLLCRRLASADAGRASRAALRRVPLLMANPQ